MIRLIKTALCSPSDEAYDILGSLLAPDYDGLVTDQEKAFINFIFKTKAATNQFVSESYFLDAHQGYRVAFDQAPPLNPADMKTHLSLLMKDRMDRRDSSELMQIVSGMQSAKDFNDETFDKIRGIFDRKAAKVDSFSPLPISDMRATYTQLKTTSTGMLTFVPEIDQRIGGISKGTVNIILGYTGQFKTTWALNIAYKNCFDLGYNAAYISLEVPKEDINWNILSRHSFCTRFGKPFVGHEKMRKATMTVDEENHVFDVVAPDYDKNAKGRLVILDETDFASFSFLEIRQKLELVDAWMIKETGSGLDAVFFDHANLFKYNGQDKRLSQNEIINQYISFIRSLAIRFIRRDGEWVKLAQVVLMQANREGFKRAHKKGGKYDLLAISEANEGERAAYRVLSVYTNEELKAAKEGIVCLLKNRSGGLLEEPTSTFADPEAYVFGEEVQGFNSMPTAADLDAVLGGGGIGGGLFDL